MRTCKDATCIWFHQGTRICSVTVEHEWNCSLPCLLLLTIFQLYHLPLPFPPPVSNSSCLFTQCQPQDSSCCTALLHFSVYCTARFKMFSLFLCLLLCIFCVKTDCVSWVPRLILLDLGTNWSYHPLLSPFPPAPGPSQHQSLFQ